MESETTAKILVVDDNPEARELLQDLLESLGYQVVIASNGEEALAAVRVDPPDLVILDVMMPYVDGFSVCKRLKDDEASRFIPIILVTALSERSDKIRGIEAGADDFIVKPYDRLELLTRVRSLLKVKYLTDELDGAQNIIFTLALALEAKDPYTRGHSERVADLAARLSAKAGLSAREQSIMRNAGILHDIGKIGIDEAILNKPGPLTPEEYDHVREHPSIGEHICEPLRFARPMLPMIRQHGERYDGQGHPDGLRGTEICLGARIIAIADAYDAMTSDRPYRSRMSKDKAITNLRQVAGRQFDPELVGLFVDMLEEEGTAAPLATTSRGEAPAGN